MSEKVFQSNVWRGLEDISIHIPDDNDREIYLMLRHQGMERKRIVIEPKYLEYADFYQQKLRELGLL